MDNKALKLGEKIDNHAEYFRMYPPLWKTISSPGINLDKNSWTEIKYLNKQNNGFSDEVKNLPDDKGGIYMYIVKSPVLPDISDYLVYIGRAQITENHSLRVRCKKYWQEYSRDDERPKITKMINYFKKFLYLKYIAIDDNDIIVDLEKKLINSLLPPFNDQIPDKTTRDAVKAFKR